MTPKIKFEKRTVSNGIRFLGVLGAGRFAKESHLPFLTKTNPFHVAILAGKTPVNAFYVAKKFSVPEVTCDSNQILQDDDIKAVLITTPPSAHTHAVVKALKAGKDVYVEKPLCISKTEHAEIEAAYRSASVEVGRPVLFVGFNRRFSPASHHLRKDLAEHSGPLEIQYTFNRLPLTYKEWFRGSIKGHFLAEVCHAVDWILWMAGSPLQSHSTSKETSGETIFSFKFGNGTKAHLHYKPVLNQSLPKEKAVVKVGDQRWEITDFLHMNVFQRNSLMKKFSWQSKGHHEIWAAFASAVNEAPAGDDPFGFFASSKAVLELSEALPHS